MEGFKIVFLIAGLAILGFRLFGRLFEAFWWLFRRQTFPFKGGSEFEAGVSKDYFAFKIEKCDPPLTKIRH